MPDYFVVSKVQTTEPGTETIATWDFRDANAACANTHIERATGTVSSDVEGIILNVDATNYDYP